jgi:hypothetical protein
LIRPGGGFGFSAGFIGGFRQPRGNFIGLARRAGGGRAAQQAFPMVKQLLKGPLPTGLEGHLVPEMAAAARRQATRPFGWVIW